MDRTATAVWQGTGKEGSGHLSTQSGTLSETPYSFVSRFEQGDGTNPEELVAAAHAGCFTMKMSFLIAAAGLTADRLETTCKITLADGAITNSHLTLKAKVPGLSQEAFDAAVKEAETGCPISKLLDTEISVDASLEG